MDETEADTVFYTETSHPTNDTSITQLLPTYNEDSSDSGVIPGNQDNSNSSPNITNDQPLVFNVSSSHNSNEESTQC